MEKKNPIFGIATLLVGGLLVMQGSKKEESEEKPLKMPNSIDYDDPELKNAMLKASNPISVINEGFEDEEDDEEDEDDSEYYDDYSDEEDEDDDYE